MIDDSTSQGSTCPIPLPHTDRIVLGHGSGGRMTHNLITQIFLPHLGNPILNLGNDAGVIPHNLIQMGSTQHLVVSTDSHVVSPLFFPGGDIGKLAVCGTVNDVAMMGAIPLYLTASFIIEEGFEIQLLEKIIASMKDAAEESRIQIVAGDTKVVQKGRGDGVFITSTGIGLLNYSGEISGTNAKPGDIVLISGSLGDHGMAVLAARGEMGFSTDIHSDIAPLNQLVNAMLAASTKVHVLRDPTRGGLATTLNEIAFQSKVGILINEQAIPVKPTVAGMCEMLGFDPLYVANEGKLIAIVAKEDAEKILKVMQQTKYGKDGAIIGEVTLPSHAGVLLKTPYGSTRILDTLSGEMLPRIC